MRKRTKRRMIRRRTRCRHVEKEEKENIEKKEKEVSKHE